jgi:MYXO-CTERM domain-containing protein
MSRNFALAVVTALVCSEALAGGTQTDPVPVMSSTGAVALGLGLLVAGLVLLRRRRR